MFGLHTMGAAPHRLAVQREARAGGAKPAASFGAFLVGLAFAFGWTPCIGPILAGILAIAGAQETVGQGMRLLAVYSLGLGVPFLLTALAINQFFAASRGSASTITPIEVASGLLLCAIGVLIFTNRFTIIAQWLVAVPADAVTDWQV